MDTVAQDLMEKLPVALAAKSALERLVVKHGLEDDVTIDIMIPVAPKDCARQPAVKYGKKNRKKRSNKKKKVDQPPSTKGGPPMPKAREPRPASLVILTSFARVRIAGLLGRQDVAGHVQ